LSDYDDGIILITAETPRDVPTLSQS
jgi:hypothetical protein